MKSTAENKLVKIYLNWYKIIFPLTKSIKPQEVLHR